MRANLKINVMKKLHQTNLPLLLILFLTFSVSLYSQKLTFNNGVDYDTTSVMNSIFAIQEVKVFPSPSNPASYTFNSNQKVIDYDVSPSGLLVATLIETSKSKTAIKFWQIGQNQLNDSCALPIGLKYSAIVWHPKANALFVLGNKESDYQIIRVDKNNNKWNFTKIYNSIHPLRRLIISPRPFAPVFSENTAYYYRLFFGMDNGDKSFRIVSITETGRGFYQLVGPKESWTTYNGDYDGEHPTISMIESDWALPIAFHPAGHEIIFENKNKQFFHAPYYNVSWDNASPLKTPINTGSIRPTPNGLGLIHWTKERSGIGVYLFASNKEDYQLTNYNFISTPSSVPDGKGIVGLTTSNDQYTLNYLPIDVPMADVINAWMFAKTEEETSMLNKDYGLFRPNQGEQLYQLYETENYYCNSYSKTTPTRPYLVTTDIFWEIFGAAYQGLFILKERDEAIPNFWKFVEEADNFLKLTDEETKWRSVFTTLLDLKNGNTNNPELSRIEKEIDDVSDITEHTYTYSNLKPRGYYTSSEEFKIYFKAFRYFTTILSGDKDQEAIMELNTLPSEVKKYAEKWINAYSGFIAPSRSTLTWDFKKEAKPIYCKYPNKNLSIFPLSWGFDNEVLYSTVYHPNVPKEFQLVSSNGFRLIPSGLDFASVLGSGLADNLLASDYKEYPSLRRVIDNLKGNYKKCNKELDLSDNLYNKWINALANQWTDTLSSTNGDKDKAIWQTKRLQTGLATWATLRHATVLVNERTGAECGEGGFEDILMRAPRGYVEPDPATFGKLAGMFEAALKHLSPSTEKHKNVSEGEWGEDAKISLYKGITIRLKDAASEARAFQKMAEKERRGEELTDEENDKILFVARTAEHLFLVFNSLANKDFALSTPDPMAKIADVAGNGPYLMSAVGNPMEWDYIIPFYGRHQIVKGSVYSYYEFTTPTLMNDQDWRTIVNVADFTPWIKPFITKKEAAGQPTSSY